MRGFNIKKLISDEKVKKIILICGLAGIALIFLSSFIELPAKNSAFDIVEYRDKIQSSVSEMLTKVEGVGDCSVLITMENSVEDVYLQNSSTKTKEIEPTIRGIVVACDGGDDPVVVERVSEIVTKALGISSAKVCVTKSVY